MATTTRVLKGAAPMPGRRIEAAVFDADRRVREMVAAGEEEARRIVAAAEAARDRIATEAAEVGRRDGEARAAAALVGAALERDRLLRAAGREVAGLALAIARKVLGRELACGGDAIVSLAAAALAEARERREVVLRVSPADAATIRAAAGTLAGALSRAPLQLREDPSLGRGDAIVDTEAGSVDARIATQLAAIARAIEEEQP
jgi:flagellar biosynthesis/type III secretory pathway protein FliH